MRSVERIATFPSKFVALPTVHNYSMRTLGKISGKCHMHERRACVGDGVEHKNKLKGIVVYF